MQNRDPEDRPANNALGVGRAILANRLSHFLNIRGPSATIDTACSGSLVGLDMACRYLSTGEVEAAIVATSNMYMSPEHMIDAGNVGSAHSPTALCHTFDVAADGYVKAEAVSAVIVKRLADAIRDRDPIRAVVLGTANTSNGRTAGIASPNSDAQALAIRQAYANAGISDFNLTTYLECHGTGTQAGDPTEVRGAGSVFAPTRPADKPLIIGSIKSNIGHSEPAAGISGLLKAVLAIEHGMIPGNPTFINPSPKIDFVGNKVKAFRHAIPWPQDAPRRASVNSFGYGGSNAHAIVEQAPLDRTHHVKSYYSAADEEIEEEEGEYGAEDDATARPQVVVLSANDAHSLNGNVAALTKHLLNPRVRVRLADLAYTLSERRTRLWHRAFVTTRSAGAIDEKAFVAAKKGAQPPRVGFVFTGQGAQWPQMGAELVRLFPRARSLLEELDAVLQRQQALEAAPAWSIVQELTEARSAEHLRQPEFSQPLVTALQLCLLDVLDSWGVRPEKVVGHSSGEIAAAYAAGLLDRAGAIKAAFYRGRAAVNRSHEAEKDVGMLAVGLGPEAAQAFLEDGHYAGSAWIACFNSPSSVTISGKKAALETLQDAVKAAGHFARLLQVDLAYHSALMDPIGQEYEHLLHADPAFQPLQPPGENTDSSSSSVAMYSSVTGALKTGPADAAYWKANMVSPVRFEEALTAMLTDRNPPTVLIEIGPSGALAGPVSQVIKALPGASSSGAPAVVYGAAWSRGNDPAKSLFDTAGRLFISGADIDLSVVNGYDEGVRTVVDLPNYTWNHTVKYWHENVSSRDWRFRKYVAHDLLGSKILGTPWQAPTWRNRLSAANVPWLLDHKMGGDAIMPGAGFVTLALEAMWQKHCAVENLEGVAPNDLCYRFRNVKFSRALVIEENKDVMLTLSLTRVPGDKHWHEFRISSTLPGEEDLVREHCWGLARIQDAIEDEVASADPEAAPPLQNPQGPKLWYKAEREIGMDFGPAFQRLLQIEAVSGQRSCRTLLSLEPPPSRWTPQSYYPIHPAALDGCLQTPIPGNAEGERGNVKDVMIPGVIDDFVINKVPARLTTGRSVAHSTYSGRGRRDQDKSWIADTTVYDSETGRLVMRVRGLNYLKLDVPPRPDPHTFLRVEWKPDVTLLSQDQLLLQNAAGQDRVDGLIDLVAHKTPSLRVLEVNLDAADRSSLWFPEAAAAAEAGSSRSAYSRYDFASTDARAMVTVQERLQDRARTSFLVVNPTDAGEALGIPADAVYDLVIIKTSKETGSSPLQNFVASIQPFLADAAFTLLVRHGDARGAVSNASSPHSEPGDQSSSPVVSPSSSASESGDSGPTASSSSSVLAADEAEDVVKSLDWTKAFWTRDVVHRLVGKAAGVLASSILEVSSTTHGDTGRQAYFWQQQHTNKQAGLDIANRGNNLLVARLSEDGPSPLGSSIRSELQQAGWNVKQQGFPLPPASKQEADVVLVLDELVGPVLSKISTPQQWEAVKELVGCGKPVVWVTQGAQGQAGAGQRITVTEPERAMVHGLFRVARREDERARLVTLDVQNGVGSADTGRAIRKVLDAVAAGRGSNNISEAEADEEDEEATPAAQEETEYMERDGLLYVQRLVPDRAINAFKRAETEGLEPVPTDFHGTRAQLQLHAERLGTLQSLMWCETGVYDEDPLEDGHIEVEVMAVGVNFKDVATTMGIVPEDEYMIGFECAGVVKKLGAGVTRFRPGDRVCILKPGSYANRVRVAVERCHAIPDTMTFEEAATIPSVYLCSLYSLYHMANLKEGQSVLIHSATGGVGIACIELAQYKKAEIYVTVGTEEKRQFLEANYGIPRDHMFSSRSAKFADEIMRLTKGRGVDCVVNSLIGELLDASWRIIADGGTMVEIGKRDIVDRNTLAMEPFDRNCSFRAVDMSFTKDIHDQRIASLFAELFVLIDGGHIRPIRPITTFGFDDVPAALQYIRSGRHLGKIVISNSKKGDEKEDADVQVLARPAVRKLQLRPDVSYLIVGGLKGACGTLATHMARHGAKHIIVNSRSGIADEASARIIRNCAFYGCAVSEAKGDVGDLGSVRRMFQTARPRIGGIVQGAMVLRDRPLETMTLDDYRTAIHAKVQGTWNLHVASQEAGPRHALDFFTMLSSTSGIIGNKGQANYAAANTFLDAFASYRRALGLRAHTVDLGVIEDVGYVAEQDDGLEVRFDKRQWTPIGETMLRRILTHSVLQQSPDHGPISPPSAAQMITGVAVPLRVAGDAASADLAREPRFAYLFASHGHGGSSEDEAALDGGSNSNSSNDAADQAVRALKAMHKSGAEGPALARACVDALAAQFVKILRLESEVEPGRPLMAYGLDSLSAVELRNWIRTKLGVELTTLDITNASSLIALADKVVGKLPDLPANSKGAAAK
ncbi:uncharacterized protein B0T15DRAFT_484525 [Chaetomium strumarium]|uniref:Carrier domain-containing protein n=1 Tax=Chaetomium strumarium TaxID=1170767 RepID=A0AAJ0GWG0_9PEZI|nr:hypothetical protein B0T15DRAFT_484525 [Chaetomium strumarium]